MTVQDLYEKLEKLISDGHGDLRVGYEDHEYGDFNEVDTVIINPNLSDKRGEVVAQLY